MAVISSDAFTRLVGTLDEPGLAAFVGDIWAARGWETTTDGAIIRAVRGGVGQTETIACVPRTRWGRPADPPDETVDVVVVATDPSRFSTAFPDDTRVLGPDELRGLFLYGIDRERADAIFERHFGRSIWVEEPDRSTLAFDLPTRSVAVGVGVLVLLVTAAALSMGGGDPGNIGEGPAPTVTAVQQPSSTAAGAVEDGPYPAGIDASGLHDLDALVAGHRGIVVNRSFELLIIHHRSVDLLAPDRRWIDSRQTADRENATHFQYRVTGLETAPDGNLSLVVYDDYADGSYTYRRIASSDTPTYRRGVVPTAGGDGAFVAVGTAYLSRYLATTESRLELITPTYPALYRLVATGNPTMVPGPVAAYRAEAVIDENGLVHRLTVSFRRQAPNATDTPTDGGDERGTEVRFELVYTDVGGTSVGRPPWYDDARRATNGTLSDLHPPDSLWWSQPIGIDYREEG